MVLEKERIKEICEEVIKTSKKEEINEWAELRKFDETFLKEIGVGKYTIYVHNKIKEKFSSSDLREAGFINKIGQITFKDRIIIPFSSNYFSARSTKKNENPKFKNLFPKELTKELFYLKGDSEKCFIVEGEPDAIRLKQIFSDCNVASIGGANSKQIFNRIYKLFGHKNIYLCYDNDEAGDVAFENTIKFLENKKHKKEVFKVIFPKQYKDIDEYLKEDSNQLLPENFEKINLKQIDTENAISQCSIYDKKEKCLNLFVSNKEEIAEAMYELQPFFYDSIGLFWFWNLEKKCYEIKDEFELMNELKKRAETKNFQVTASQFWNETLRSLKLVGRIKEPKPFKKTWVQFKDKIYDYETKECFESTPEYFNVNPIPHDLGPQKETPTIDSLFSAWVGEENVLTLKETIALSILQDYPLHRVVCLFGAGLNGKGVFLRFLTKFCGVRNVCSTNMKKILTGTFETSKLYKKLICLMGETDFGTIKDTSTLKSLSGQDLISAEFKSKNSFDFENFATIFIASNSLPITEDRTDGFYRRWLIIDFPNKFKEGSDPLLKIPNIEYNNLCNQLLDILPILIKRGKFDKDGAIEERKEKYEEKSNPLKIFMKKFFIREMGQEYPFYKFYDKYVLFCKENGFREISKKALSTLLNDSGYETEKKSVKIGQNYTKWVMIFDINEVKNHQVEKNSVEKPILVNQNNDKLDPLEPLEPMFQLNPYIENQPKTAFQRFQRFQKEEILSFIGDMDLGDGVNEEKILQKYPQYDDDKVDLLLAGDIVEVRPGFVRLLQ